jgi:hypothetical protein
LKRRKKDVYYEEAKRKTCHSLSLSSSGSLGWYIVTDVCMGGHSEAELAVGPGGLRFSGDCVLKDGGFASIRTLVGEPFGIDRDATELVFTCTGDGHVYKVMFRDSEAVGNVHWQADIQTTCKKETHRVPLSAFRGSTKGQQIIGGPNWSQVSGMGLTLSSKQEGHFTLTIHDMRCD